MENNPIPQTKSKTNKNSIEGMLWGLAAYAMVGAGGLYGLRVCWHDYAIAARDKSYTFEMLLARLMVGMLAAVIAGITVTKIANDKGKAAWLVGTIVFSIAAYIHFFRVWGDYPAWYHFAYLIPIIPVIGLSHYFIGKRK